MISIPFLIEGHSLALRKLSAWLNTISPNKVRQEIRERVIQYQNECDDVLYEYWTKGEVVNPRKTRQSTSKQLTPLRQTAERLIATGLGRLYPDIWKLVHARFDVEHITQLQPGQIGEAIEYLNVLEGEFLGKQEVKNLPASSQSVPATSDSRVLLYVRGGVVVDTLPITEDMIVASWDTFVALARRNDWIVEHKDDFVAKISTLLA